MDKRLVKELNRQMNAEFYSSYLYFGMATYFDSKNLNGFANWMHVQAHEEWTHGMKFYRFLLDRNIKPDLAQINAPPKKWKSAINVFDEALAHEQEVTNAIDRLVDLARSTKDKATEVFLSWFVTEQVEEEAQAIQVVEKLKIIGDNPNGLFMMDHQLGMRKKE